MRTPTSRERAILRGYGTWEVVEILLDPEYGIHRAKKASMGTTHYRVGEDVLWMQTTSKGIELGFPPAVEVLTWPTVRRIAETIPPSMLTRLRAWRDEHRQAQRDYPRFTASAKAAGCGMPSRWVHPITEAQALYAAEYEAWERDELSPAIALRQRLNAQRQALLDEALLDTEPTDLLDLLGVRA